MQFEWIDFYSEFADKLMKFRYDRADLIDRIKKIYEKIKIKMPTLEKDNNLTDIDPFTVYGLFNKGITNANRMLIMGALADELGVNAKIPDNFDGIPVLNNMSATFYGFTGDRGSDDIENLWKMFELALDMGDSADDKKKQKFIEIYDKVSSQFCVKWNITMGLYWIRPYSFINLDSRNRWFIMQPENMPAGDVVRGKTNVNKFENNVAFARNYAA